MERQTSDQLRETIRKNLVRAENDKQRIRAYVNDLIKRIKTASQSALDINTDRDFLVRGNEASAVVEKCVSELAEFSSKIPTRLDLTADMDGVKVEPSESELSGDVVKAENIFGGQLALDNLVAQYSAYSLDMIPTRDDSDPSTDQAATDAVGNPTVISSSSGVESNQVTTTSPSSTPQSAATSSTFDTGEASDGATIDRETGTISQSSLDTTVVVSDGRNIFSEPSDVLTSVEGDGQTAVSTINGGAAIDRETRTTISGATIDRETGIISHSSLDTTVVVSDGTNNFSEPSVTVEGGGQTAEPSTNGTSSGVGNRETGTIPRSGLSDIKDGTSIFRELGDAGEGKHATNDQGTDENREAIVFSASGVTDAGNNIAKSQTTGNSNVRSSKPRVCKGGLANKCECCDTTFKSKQLLSAHITNAHIRCSKCRMVFRTVALYRDHLAIHARNDQISKLQHARPTMSVTVDRDSAVDETQLPKSPLLTRRASTSVNSTVALETGDTPSRFTCNHCKSSFSHRITLVKHMNIHTKEKLFSCSVCSETFYYGQKLRSHMERYHGDRHQCNACERIFQRKAHLDQHRKSLHEKGTFSCSICEKTFVSKDYLRSHQWSVHSRVVFRCNSCPKSFKQKHNLICHISSHHNNEVLPCNKCGRNFAKGYLAEHIRLYHGNLRFSCEICRRDFRAKRSLDDHNKKTHKR